MKWILLLLCIFLLASCSTPDDRVRVGVLIPLTGDFSAFGEQLRSGIEDAAGENILLVFEDSECEPAAAVTGFLKLADVDDVRYVIGPACGSPQEAVAPLAREREMLVLLPSAAPAGLSERSGGSMFQLQYSLEDESRIIAERMFAEGHETAVLIKYQNAFSQTHARSFRENYDGEILQEITFNDIADPIYTEVLKIKEFDPDAIFVADLAFFIANGRTRLEEAGVTAPIFSHYATEFPPVREFVENVTYSFPADVTEEGGIMYHYAHKAMLLLNDALSSCDSPECVKERLIASGRFDERGIGNADIEFRTIRGGEPVRLDS